MAHPLFEKHRPLLEEALAALEKRGNWSPYAEVASAYGDPESGRQAFDAYRGAQFYLDQPGLIDRVGEEVSPYGLPLNISYPRCASDVLTGAAKTAMASWVKAGPEGRAGVCAEILAGLNARSLEIGHAVMHTTGQSFLFAFQMGGPLAQSRGLEAVTAAYREMIHVPETALWERGTVRIAKRFTAVPRGVALVIASATSPLATAYAGLFASLATGNAVIVKPHPAAVLPLAITVAAARQVLKEAGFDPNLVSLLVDVAEASVGRDVAIQPDVRIVDYTGTADFGQWLEDNARQAVVFAQKAGINCVVVDSTDDYTGMLKCLAVALCLNSGQMGTTPKVIFVSADGLRTPEGVADADRFGRDLGLAVSRLLEEPARALDVLGTIRSPATLARMEATAATADVLRESSSLVHPQWPEAVVRTPLLLKSSTADGPIWANGHFGPVAFLVPTATSAEALSLAERTMGEHGALTFAVYTTDINVQHLAEEISLRTGVALSLNLTDGVLLVQPAGFSDFHGAGASSAANACQIDNAFVAGRFFVVQSRRPA